MENYFSEEYAGQTHPKRMVSFTPIQFRINHVFFMCFIAMSLDSLVHRRLRLN